MNWLGGHGAPDAAAVLYGHKTSMAQFTDGDTSRQIPLQWTSTYVKTD